MAHAHVLFLCCSSPSASCAITSSRKSSHRQRPFCPFSAHHLPYPHLHQRHGHPFSSTLNIRFFKQLDFCYQIQKAMDARHGCFTTSAAAFTANSTRFWEFCKWIRSFWLISRSNNRHSCGKSCMQAAESSTGGFFSGEINAGILIGALCLLALGFGGEASAVKLGSHLSQPLLPDSDLTIRSTFMAAPSIHFSDTLRNANGYPLFESSARTATINFVSNPHIIFHGSIDNSVRVDVFRKTLHHFKSAESRRCVQRNGNDFIPIADSIIDSSCDQNYDAGEQEADNMLPGEVTNESVVEEAWQVVNDVFLDARNGSWSQAEWLKKKEEIFRRPIHSRMAAYAVIRNLLSSLEDPFTRFLTPAEFTKMAKYDLTGIGINVGEWIDENGANHLKILGIVLGSPAQIAGVREGDELLSVEGKSVVGKSAFEASSLIRGPKGRPVSIEIKHGPCGQLKKLVIDRYQDVKTPVYYRLESSKDSGHLTGYIRLKEFNALAKRDLVIAMQRLRDSGASSFLLDLRDNLGGLVQSGIEIAKLFLEEGETVVYTVGREARSAKNIMATGLPLTRAPLIILVNNQTASASEIVAAALRDNCRAILVGRKTFGKGLIQSVYELSDGSGIVLTVGKYVTPGQHDIDRNGIEPDFKHVPRLSEAKEKLTRCQIPKQSGSTTGFNKLTSD